MHILAVLEIEEVRDLPKTIVEASIGRRHGDGLDPWVQHVGEE